MPLQLSDQLQLLRDLLQDHLEECSCTVSEMEQIERLVKTLMLNHEVHPEIKAILDEVYYYGQKGKYSGDPEEHITNHQDQLSNWVESIEQFT